MINDIRHPFIQQIQKLRKREHRHKTGMVIVEGYPEVKRAYEAKVLFQELYICPELVVEDWSIFQNIKITEVSKEVFSAIAFGSRLKGILAVCQPEILRLTDLKIKTNPFFVILENVEKPGNLGGVIRTCDGAGVDAVIMCDGKTDIYNQHVVRSSIGTVFTVPTVSTDKQTLLAFLRSHQIQIFAATAHAQHVYTQADFVQPAALLIGNEHEGVSSFWFEQAYQKIKIPMQGQASSLNASTSAAILIYEALRQRQVLN
ncbi:MAG: RNA methyltransferase [Candidatus Omnitrophica bacterium]|nr:RNA methyltransferase [Candidatus Omnitrophota bacterium]